MCFSLKGDIALWRNPYEPMGTFSSLGPAPSHLAGMLGAAMGMATPHSIGSGRRNDAALKHFRKKGLFWPLSEELLQWQERNNYAIAVRWLGKIPKRISWNVNGIKGFKGSDSSTNLRILQQIIENPEYEVLIRLNNRDAVKKAGKAIRNPAFPLYLGASFCRAIVENVREIEAPQVVSEGNAWAYRTEKLTVGECTPFTQHVVNQKECFERISCDGFWVYPTPLHNAPKAAMERKDPCEIGYVHLEVE